jgi:hypothetical protein
MGKIKMFSMKRRSVLKASVASFALGAAPKWSLAQDAAYGPEDLKSVLTPYGAIRAGNAEGTIPPWTGGYSTVPPGYQQGDPRPVPFADEKSLFSITAANMSQHQDKLSAGAMALVQKYADFRMDVYTTHRTGIAPQYVYDNIYKNATSAQLSPDGNSITGAYGGIPFPIPTNGHQVMWNHLLAWQGTTVHYVSDAYTVTAAGQLVFESRAQAWEQYYYYFQTPDPAYKEFISEALVAPIAPPYQAGGSILIHASLNPSLNPAQSWEYLVGQRRVRRAPELQYDTPNSIVGGVTNWDESYIFNGDMHEYDYKLVGKKEIYVPYNVNKLWTATAAEQFGPHFMNPDLIRWELHRVWVVEMTVRPDSRNVDVRRTVYFDEDTGIGTLADIYDASGLLWKFEMNTLAIIPDVPCIAGHKAYVTYDLHAGDYSTADIPNADTQPPYKLIPQLPNSFFTPGELAATAGGF